MDKWTNPRMGSDPGMAGHNRLSVVRVSQDFRLSLKGVLEKTRDASSRIMVSRTHAPPLSFFGWPHTSRELKIRGVEYRGFRIFSDICINVQRIQTMDRGTEE